MRNVSTLAVFALVALAPATLRGADDFYTTLLQRGISEVVRGNHAAGVSLLRVAAFGMVDSLPQYQTAYVYIAVASERLGRTEDARSAAMKVLQAERIDPVYQRLTLDATIRGAFQQMLPKMISADQLANAPTLLRAPSVATPPTAVAATTPAPPTPAPVVPKATPAPPPPPVTVATVPQTAQPAPVQPRPTVVAPPTTTATTTPTPPPATAKPTPPPPVRTATVEPRPAHPAASNGQSRATIASPTPAPSQASAQQPRTTAPTTQAKPQSALVAAARHAPSESAIMSPDFSAKVSEAERQLNEGKLLAAKQSYLRLASTPNLQRASLLAIAAGLSQTSAWRESSMLYQKALPFGVGEEQHMFHEAVNRYELGEYNAARQFLSRAVPALPASRELDLYRNKIERMQ